MRPRPALPALLLLGLLCTPASHAVDPSGYSVEIRPVARSAGAITVGDSTSIDFGTVGALGAPPRSGQRYTLDNGDALLVATVEVTVRLAAGSPALPSTSRRSTGSEPMMRRPGSTYRSPISERLELFATVYNASPPVGVLVAPTGEVDWAHRWGEPTTSSMPFRVADVTPGTPMRIDLAMYVPAGVSGFTSASVQFEVR